MKKAFTLTELLITLGIVGIVAALTIPHFIEESKKKVLVAQFKKTYSMLNEAVSNACLDSNVETFDMTSYSTNISGDYTGFLKKYIGGRVGNGFASKYGTIANPTDKATVVLPSAKLVSEDGQAFAMKCDGKSCYVYFDTNGDEAPNIGGRDMFTLIINKETNEVKNAANSSACKESISGGGCAGYIIENDNMDYN